MLASTALTVASPFLPIVRLRPSSAVVSFSCNRATAYASVVAALLMAYFAPAEANAFAPPPIVAQATLAPAGPMRPLAPPGRKATSNRFFSTNSLCKGRFVVNNNVFVCKGTNISS